MNLYTSNKQKQQILRRKRKPYIVAPTQYSIVNKSMSSFKCWIIEWFINHLLNIITVTERTLLYEWAEEYL